ncbi:fibronectin-like isoform X1 [Denticeps clupeoides]|uniref:fibronectin-like isoform X1 n=1 Tax=Denticeps clupeoides TaxID=299321 RepID=UPI0010A3F992|nr:fibronectin-like isoform X1 [Denticeps clupeoides]
MEPDVLFTDKDVNETEKKEIKNSGGGGCSDGEKVAQQVNVKQHDSNFCTMREPVERESINAEEEERAKGVKKTCEFKNDSGTGASLAEEGTNEALTWSDLRPAGPVRFSSVRSDSVVLNWEAPAGLTGNQKFMVKWEQKQKLVSGSSAEIQELTPGEEYEFTVEPEYGNQSPYHTTSAIRGKIRLPLVINFKLENTSMCVQCEDSEHLSRHQKFKLSWGKKGELKCVDIPGLNTEFQNVEPGEEHEFTVYMLSDDDKPIMSASKNVLTEIAPPVDVKLCSDDGTVSVSWKKPAGLNAASYLVSLYSNKMLMKSLYTQSLNCSFQVHPDKKHMISIETVLKNGKKSKPVEITPYKGASPAEEGTNEALTWSDLRPAGPVRFSSVRSDSVVLNWEAPAGLTGNQKFMVKWEQKQKLVSGSSAEIQELTPGEEYEFTVEPEYGNQSPYHTTSAIRGKIRLPLVINFKLENTSMCVQCEDSEHLSRHQKFKLSWGKKGKLKCVDIPGLNTEFQNVEPGEEHEFTVYMLSDDDKPIMSASRNVLTEIAPPVDVKLCSDDGTVSVSWKKPAGLNAASYLVSLYSNKMLMKSLYTQSLNCSFQVHPDKKHMISIETVLKNGKKSKPVEITPYKGASPAEEGTNEALTWSDLRPAGPVHFSSVRSDSVVLNWEAPAGLTGNQKFMVKWEQKQKLVSGSSAEIQELTPGEEYEFTVEPEYGNQSPYHTTSAIRGKIRLPLVINFKLENTSMCVQCEDSEHLSRHQKFKLSWGKMGKLKCVDIPGLNTEFQNVEPGEEHEFTVYMLSDDDKPIMSASKNVLTEIAPPVDVKLCSDDGTVSVSWKKPAGLNAASYLVSLYSNKMLMKSLYTQSLNCSFQVHPDKKHMISIETVLKNGKKSKPVEITPYKGASPAEEGTNEALTWSDLRPAGPVRFSSVRSDSVVLNWEAPAGLTGNQKFMVKWEQKQKLVSGLSAEIQELTPGEEYEFTVEPEYGNQSPYHTTSAIRGKIRLPLVINFKWENTSMCVQCEDSEHLSRHQKFKLSWRKMDIPGLNTEIQNVEPGEEHEFTVYMLSDDDKPIMSASRNVLTEIPPPVDVKLCSDDGTVSVSWKKPAGLNAASYLVSLYSNKMPMKSLYTQSQNCSFQLQPDKKHMISIETVLKNGKKSKPVEITPYKGQVPAPENLSVEVNSPSVSVTWRKPPGVDQVSYLLSYGSKGEEEQTISTESLQYSLDDLRFCSEYKIRVCTVLNNLHHSKPVYKNIRTGAPVQGKSTDSASVNQQAPPMPQNLTVSSVSATSAKLSWSLPDEVGGYFWSKRGKKVPYSFLISYHSEKSGTNQSSTGDNSTEITGLTPYTEYTVSVRTVNRHGVQSSPASSRFYTVLPAPEMLTVVSVSATSAKISWIPPHGMDQIAPSFLISYWSKESKPDKPSLQIHKSISTNSSSREITDLKPDTPYTLTVGTEVKHGGRSQPATVTFNTEKMRFYTKNVGKLPIQNTQSLKELLTRNDLVEVNSVEKCDVVLVFCLVVSRAGTDIEAALVEINKETKPAILVVMHHTLSRDVFPDSSRFVTGEQVLITVDCLFQEDQGLLRCKQNDTSFTQIQNILAHLVNKFTPSKQDHV